MSVFTVRIEIGDSKATHFEELEALVGTPSFLTAIPTSTLRQLAIHPYKRETFILPDESEAEYDVGHAVVRVQGRESVTQVVFVEEDFEPRMGRLTLEQLHLRADIENEKLVPMRARLVSHPSHF